MDTQTQVVTNGEFLETLRRSGLVIPRVLQQVSDFSAKNPALDGKSLATSLVQSEVLSRFQAERLLEGRSRGFFIHDYKLMDVLGVGGMGFVYRAIDTRNGNRVALKVLSSRHKNDNGMRARLRLEAQAGMLLRHPKIVQTIDSGVTDDVFGEMDYVVLEYMEGIALHEFVVKHGPVEWTSACDIVLQAAEGLAHAHQMGLVHRDVKPDNLLLSADGSVKILDFGLALLGKRTAEDEFSLSMIFGQDCLGTADYMAPEQADDSNQSDARSDIYGLGCTLYVALTGRRPFGGETPAKVIQAHRTMEARSVRHYRPEIPEEVAAIVARMMAKKPEDVGRD